MESLPPPVAAFRPRGRPLLAWLVIALAVGGIVWWHNLPPTKKDGAPNEDSYSLLVMGMQGRQLVGSADLFKKLGHPSGDLAKQSAALNTGPLSHRLRAIIVTGELAGPKAALEQLHELDDRLAAQAVKPSATQGQLRDLLGKLYGDYAAGRWTAPAVADDQRAELRQHLGWFGALALAPEQGPDSAAREAVLAPAQRVAILLMVVVTGFLILGSCGLIVLTLVVSRIISGKLRAPLVNTAVAGGIYAETFAVWMLLFLALSRTAAYIPAGQFQFLVLAAAMLLSLSALAWPVARGISWRQVRDEIGLTRGRQPRLEPLYGVACYTMALPLLAIGLLLTLILMHWQGTVPGLDGSSDRFDAGKMPSHPIVEPLLYMGWWGQLQMLCLASVAAPIVEETMFRGVLYRQLREATVKCSLLVSVVASGLIVSFVFAVIHPQGLATVPALMALAFGFALAREWRGSLVPAMVAHGVNNAVVLTMVTLLMAP